MATKWQSLPLNVSSIRIIEDRSNVQSAIQAISALDHILSESSPLASSNKKYGLILGDLFNYFCSLQPSLPNSIKYHEYVYQSFKSLVHFKTIIKIDIHSIATQVHDAVLRKLIIPTLIRKEYERKDFFSWIADDQNQENLINPVIFIIFKQVKEVEINTSGGIHQDEHTLSHGYHYPFSWLSLLSMIKMTSIKRVKIITGHTIPSSEYNELLQKYDDHKIELQVDQSKYNFNRYRMLSQREQLFNSYDFDSH